MKILQVLTDGHANGGAQVSVLFLRDELTRRGHEVKILSSDIKGDGPTFNDYQTKLISRTSTIKALHHLFYFRAYSDVRNIIKEFNPDIIHFHNIGVFSPSIFFAIDDIPAVMTVHGPEEFTAKLLPWVLPPSDYKNILFDLDDLTFVGTLRYYYYRFIQRYIYQLGMRRIKTFIAPSRYMADAIKEDVPPEKIKQIYNGIKLPTHKSPPNNRRILYVGRLEEIKGVDYLIKAFAEVVKKIPEAELRIVGDGHARKDLERLAETLNLDRHIYFCGWVKAGDGVAQEYENASLLVIPSIWPENLPTVCIEALAIGRPVIGTRTGGIPELIHEGSNGYIVPMKDQYALCDAILRIFNNTDKLIAMSQAATISISGFSVQHFVDQVENLYNSFQ